MINLNNRTILDDGTVICTDSAIVEMLYAGQNIQSVTAQVSEDVELYNQVDKFLDTNYGSTDTADGEIYQDVNWFAHWLTPEPWTSLDVETVIMSKCKTDQERERVNTELELFRERNMLPVLQHLMYLVDHWREKNILWGVGRGSSVSSFVLFLIGINRINPLEYELTIDEFLK